MLDLQLHKAAAVQRLLCFTVALADLAAKDDKDKLLTTVQRYNGTRW